MQGTCGNIFSNWETVPYAGTIPNITTTNFSQEKCYQFSWQVSDDTGTTSFPSTVIVTTKPNIIPLQTVSVGKVIFVKLNTNNLFVSLNPICNTPSISATKHIFEVGDTVTLTALPDGIAGSCTWSADNDDLSDATYLDTNHCIVKVSPTQNTTYTVTMQSCQNTNSVNLSLASSNIMQDFTAADCASYATPNSTGATIIGNLTDIRDGKSYEIRKMPDGKCWMVDNLAYGGGTDGSSDYCVGKTTTDGWRNATTQDLASAVATNGLNPTDGSRNIMVGNCSNIGSTTEYCFTGVGVGKCGYFYNWAAAMQSDLGYYGSTTIFSEPRQGICPSGWHLPINTEFVNLDKAMGGPGNNRTDAALAFANAHYMNQNQFKGSWSGIVYHSSGAAYYQSAAFAVLSSTYYSISETYHFGINIGGSLGPLNVSLKNNGFSVRCVKNNVPTPITATTTMQEWDDCDSYATPNADSATMIGYLQDSRDGRSYEIRKMPDGKCWMVDNLAYGGGTDGSSDYCAAKTTTDGWRVATTQALSMANATSGLNPTDGSRNTLVGNCSNAGATTAFCQADGRQCGYYYNWPAAMQSTLAYGGSTASFTGQQQGICPAGWHLPQANEFIALDLAMGGTGETRAGTSAVTFAGEHYFNPNQFKGARVGTVNAVTGTSYYQTRIFYIWSGNESSSGNNSRAGHFGIDTDETVQELAPSTGSGRSNGFTVRCIKD